MVTASSSQKNLWVAASDGDLGRVRELIEDGLSPNEKDANSYTPMHAAASYAHLELLDYLLSVGGDINLPDDDGETPLFTVETMPAARYLVEKGADVNWKNNEGQLAAETLEEDQPEIAAYLASLSSDPNVAAQSASAGPGADGTNDMAVNQFADQHSTALMEEARIIMEEAERDGVEPDERLREAIERHVRQGMVLGGTAAPAAGADGAGAADDEEAKRPRTDGQD